MRHPHTSRLLVCIATSLVPACGGKAVVDAPAGTGGATASTTTSTTTVAGCQQHADCPAGLCVFGDGSCVLACDVFSPCGVGSVCSQCLTSSCPTCNDCLGGCLPAAPGTCDDHDDCGGGDVCLYGAQLCAPPCVNGGCAEPNLVCNPCATSSCPGCENCLGACTESF